MSSMGNSDIAFNNLGIYLKDVPSSFSIFGFEIALYGIIIGIGTIAGFCLALRLAGKSGVKKELVWDYIIWGIIFGVVCARLYYVIFAWDYYKDDFWSIFNIRQGGLAIYGGVIGAFGSMVVFCKIKKTSFTALLDVAVPGLILGQIIGRWGNFFNREVFGGYYDGLLSMQLPYAAVRNRDVTQEMLDHMYAGGPECNFISVHPTFLYEGALNLIVLLIMLIYRKYKKFDGEIALIYLGGYGIVRFIVEGIRTDRLTIGDTNIAISQVVAILCLVFAVVADIVVRVRLTKKAKLSSLNPEEKPAEESVPEENTIQEDPADKKVAEESTEEEVAEEESTEEETAEEETAVEETAEEAAAEEAAPDKEPEDSEN